MKTAFINNLKELKQNHDDLQRALFRSGLKVTDHYAGTAKEKLVPTVKHIAAACEGLLRADRVEAHITRLDRELPDALDYLSKIRQSDAGRQNAELVTALERNLAYVKEHFRFL